MIRFLWSLSAVVLLAGTTSAAVFLDFVNTPVPSGITPTPGSTGAPGSLDGFNALDLIVNTTSDWTAAAIFIDLSSGSMFQENSGFGGFGSTLGPTNPLGFATIPSLEWDSYLDGNALPGNADPSALPDPILAFISIAGAGADAGGPAGSPVFDSTGANISWNSAGSITTDVGATKLGRFTLSPDANGILSLAVTEADSPGRTLIGIPLVNGIIAPEPASVTALGLGGLALLRRR